MKSDKSRKQSFWFSPLWILFALGSLLFATWLMFHTFSYDAKNGSILIATKLWSDFGAHIPLIRSFSMGGNWDLVTRGIAPQYPIFPGEPIRYHYLFYLLVGFLERIGVRIDMALNIPSILVFGGLLIAIAYVSFRLFKNWKVSALSVIFFLFNGSLGFLKFFEKFPLSETTLFDIFTAQNFPAFAPWDGGLVTAFWNLNIYTNQRHLALGFLIGVCAIALAFKIRDWSFRKKIPFIIGLTALLVSLPYLHQPMLLIIGLFFIWYFILYPKLRIPLILIGIISLSLCYWQLAPVFKSGNESFTYYLGYIIHNEFTIKKFILFWLSNLGLHAFLIPLGFLIAPKRVKAFFVPIFILFIVGNMFKFSVEVAANHKFFNFALIFGNMLTAYALITITDLIKKRLRHILIKPTSIVRDLVRKFILSIACGFVNIIFWALCFILTFSGIIDFFVVANDTTLPLPDVKRNATAQWIATNTPTTAIFLNSSYLYHPASIAGRSIFLGWPYFPWSSGYEENRMPIMDRMYESKDPNIVCPLLRKYNISYVTVENVSGNPDLPTIKIENYSSYSPVYTSPQGSYFIYSTAELCK